jgi:hypothetical protein
LRTIPAATIFGVRKPIDDRPLVKFGEAALEVCAEIS